MLTGDLVPRRALRGLCGGDVSVAAVGEVQRKTHMGGRGRGREGSGKASEELAGRLCISEEKFKPENPTFLQE